MTDFYATRAVTSVGWTNPGNALGSNASDYATSTGSSPLEVGFDFSSIPDGSPITAISGVIRGYATSTSRQLFISDSVNTIEKVFNVSNTVVLDFRYETLPVASYTTAKLKDPGFVLKMDPNAGNIRVYYAKFTIEYGEPPPVVARARRWTGSAWVDASMQRFDGAAWQPLTTGKRWDGSAWV